MRRIITIILVILVITISSLAADNKEFFYIAIVLWPILAVLLVILKISDLKKAKLGKVEHKKKH